MTATLSARIDHLRIERGDDAFSGLSHEQRVRLMVRVLCGLIAYDDDPATTASPITTDGLTERLAS